MAYVSKEKKAKIAAELKKVMPAGWKYSLAVKHGSTIVLTIAKGPAELLTANRRKEEKRRGGYIQLNPYYLHEEYEGNEELVATFAAISAALNLDNHDNSDLMTDYFDVGHYVSINIGRYDKPFQVVEL